MADYNFSPITVIDGKWVVLDEDGWKKPIEWNKTTVFICPCCDNHEHDSHGSYTVCMSCCTENPTEDWERRPPVSISPEVHGDWDGRIVDANGEFVSICHGCERWKMPWEVTSRCECETEKSERIPRGLTMSDVLKRLEDLKKRTPNLAWPPRPTVKDNQ